MGIERDLLQIGFIALSTLILSTLPFFRKIGVAVSSMVASFIAGSLLPLLAPEAHAWLFPEIPRWIGLINHITLTFLGALAGTEINIELVRNRGGKVVALFSASTLSPMLLALIPAIFLTQVHNPYIGEDVHPAAFILGFTGVVALKALPVMISFLSEKGWEKSDIGSLALGAAMVVDILFYTAILPGIYIIIGTDNSNPIVGLAGIIGGLTLLRIVLKYFTARIPHRLALAIGAGVLFLAAAAAEGAGLHPIIGAMLWGLLAPREFIEPLMRETEGFIKWIAVPLFFAGLGLQHRFDVLSLDIWAMAAILFAINWLAHMIGSQMAVKHLLGTYPAAARVFGGLNRTKGLADVVFALILFDLHLITATLLGAVMIFAILSTAVGLYEASRAIERAGETVLGIPSPSASPPVTAELRPEVEFQSAD